MTTHFWLTQLSKKMPAMLCLLAASFLGASQNSSRERVCISFEEVDELYAEAENKQQFLDRLALYQVFESFKEPSYLW